jgi:5,5'-dehydrodivanillate O-demethylase
MLSKETNEMITGVGPGTPGGELLRRYWQPVCYASDLGNRATLRVKMLDEELVAYRDKQGNYGLLAEKCTHRHASLAYGFVEDGATLRCPYHGWKYNAQGRVIEQPFEPKGSNLKDEIRHPAYPVQKLGGVLFAYMGPLPAPLLPRWDILVRKDGLRRLERRPQVNANWLQAQENSADVTHTYYLHGHMLATRGVEDRALDTYYRPFLEYSFLPFKWGLLKSFVIQKGAERVVADIGNPLLFPNMLRVREGQVEEAMHWRVPIDDTHTRIFYVGFSPSKDGSDVEQPEDPAVTEVDTWQTPEGEYIMDGAFNSQDKMAWETPGPIFDRSREFLAASDRGIMMFRKMLIEAIEAVKRGEDPRCLIRDPAENGMIVVKDLAANAWTECDPKDIYQVKLS